VGQGGGRGVSITDSSSAPCGVEAVAQGGGRGVSVEAVAGGNEQGRSSGGTAGRSRGGVKNFSASKLTSLL
jgi:hypothetical protein